MADKDKKRVPNLKETLEEKKKKLEAMKERNRKVRIFTARDLFHLFLQLLLKSFELRKITS
jgi:hypothetical protein